MMSQANYIYWIGHLTKSANQKEKKKKKNEGK